MPRSTYTLQNEDFISTVYVVCPKCKEKALVLGGQPYKNIQDYEDEVRFSCTTCGYAIKYANTPKFTVDANSRGRNLTSRVLMLNSPCDPFFGFEVWYRIESKFGLLWAYNLEHLMVIENYIADTLRIRHAVPYQNKSIGSRLPQWVKDAKNRMYLLKLITKSKLR